MTVEEWMKESADLDKMIKSLGFKVKSDEMYVNGYTSPMSFNQRSELWKVKETEEKSSQDNRIETAPYTVVATHYVGFNTVSIKDSDNEKYLDFRCITKIFFFLYFSLKKGIMKK